MAAAAPAAFDHLFKIVLVGDSGVGKVQGHSTHCRTSSFRDLTTHLSSLSTTALTLFLLLPPSLF